MQVTMGGQPLDLVSGVSSKIELITVRDYVLGQFRRWANRMADRSEWPNADNMNSRLSSVSPETGTSSASEHIAPSIQLPYTGRLVARVTVLLRRSLENMVFMTRG